MPHKLEMSHASKKTILTLFLAGFCLMLLQFFMIREISAILRGTEIVILLVTVSYFSGYSIGYALTGWFSLPGIRLLAIAFWLMHITLPFSLRYFSAMLHEKSPGWSFAFVLFFAMFLLSSFYSLLLPWFIDKAGSSLSLSRLYGAELAGAFMGAVSALTLGASPMALPLMYQVCLAGVVFLLWPARLSAVALTAGVAVYAFTYPPLERHSLATHYIKGLHFQQAEPLLSVNSPYQKVDFIKSGMTGKTYIFLDGNMNFGSTSLSHFNTFLSRLPAQLLQPENALIIGAGSLQSLNNVSRHAGWVDVVEIDKAIVEGSQKFLKNINELDSISNWSLTIQDAKNYLGSTRKKYDLIIMDVPAPFTIQLGLLHSVEFYTLAKSRLTERGVLSVSLSGTFKKGNITPVTVAAAALEAFPQAFIVVPDIKGRSFIMAGNNIPFTREDILAASSRLIEEKTGVYNHVEAQKIVGDTKPMSLDNLSHPVKRSFRYVMGRHITGALP